MNDRYLTCIQNWGKKYMKGREKSKYTILQA